MSISVSANVAWPATFRMLCNRLMAYLANSNEEFVWHIDQFTLGKVEFGELELLQALKIKTELEDCSEQLGKQFCREIFQRFERNWISNDPGLAKVDLPLLPCQSERLRPTVEELLEQNFAASQLLGKITGGLERKTRFTLTSKNNPFSTYVWISDFVMVMEELKLSEEVMEIALDCFQFSHLYGREAFYREIVGLLEQLDFISFQPEAETVDEQLEYTQVSSVSC